MNIQVHDKTFEPYLSHEMIKERTKVLASEIESSHDFDSPIIIGVLDGCFRFANDLMQVFHNDYEITFAKVKSYDGVQSTGNMRELIGLQKENIRDRNVLIVEDIIDTGETMKWLLKELENAGVNTVKIATLLYKPACVKYELNIDFIGFEIDPVFVVGYGLDYNGLGRGANQIYKLKE